MGKKKDKIPPFITELKRLGKFSRFKRLILKKGYPEIKKELHIKEYKDITIDLLKKYQSVDFFNWSKTKEGHNFWNSINGKYCNNKFMSGLLPHLY
jgi:hypothetical protein